MTASREAPRGNWWNKGDRQMRYRELGQTGIKASVVGLGTWAMGGGSVWGGEPDGGFVVVCEVGLPLVGLAGEL